MLRLCCLYSLGECGAVFVASVSLHEAVKDTRIKVFAQLSDASITGEDAKSEPLIAIRHLLAVTVITKPPTL